MAVYTGILKVCENEAALAAVLGHEVAHALLQHGNERVSQAKLTSGVVAVGSALANANIDNKTTKQVTMAALGLGAQFGFLLPYSRLHESEADAMGLRISAAAGYAPSDAGALEANEKEKRRRYGILIFFHPPQPRPTHPRPQSHAKKK